MAADDNNKLGNSEPEGAIESVLSYLKDRIESPFLMSFLLSWSVINRDFLFYLFMSNDRNKHEQLANWDFSGVLVGSYCYNSWTESIWHPLILGTVMAVFFSPISIDISGLRYYALKAVISKTMSARENYNLAYQISKAKRSLETLAKEYETKNAQLSQLDRDVLSREAKINQIDKWQDKAGLGEIAIFMIESAEFYLKTKDVSFTNQQLKEAETISARTIFRMAIFTVDSEQELVVDFTGTAFEFFTDKRFFNLLDKYSQGVVLKMTNAFYVGDELNFDMTDGRRVVAHFKSSSTSS